MRIVTAVLFGLLLACAPLAYAQQHDTPPHEEDFDSSIPAAEDAPAEEPAEQDAAASVTPGRDIVTVTAILSEEPLPVTPYDMYSKLQGSEICPSEAQKFVAAGNACGMFLYEVRNASGILIGHCDIPAFAILREKPGEMKSSYQGYFVKGFKKFDCAVSSAKQKLYDLPLEELMHPGPSKNGSTFTLIHVMGWSQCRAMGESKCPIKLFDYRSSLEFYALKDLLQ